MKWKLRPRVRGLCQACVTAADVVSPQHSKHSAASTSASASASTSSKSFFDTEEINHKDIRQNALLLLKRGEITNEEYGMVLDADLKYEAGLAISAIQLDIESSLPSSPKHVPSSPPCLSPCPSSAAASCATSLCPLPNDNQDPITLDALGDQIFTFVTPQGTTIKYNIESLVEYITASGDFRDPVTRLPLTPEDILNIDNKISNVEDCQHLTSLKSIRENAHFYCVEKQKNEECQNFETCLGEIIVDILEIVETPTLGPKTSDVAEMRMYMLFSEFEAPFKLLKVLDIEKAWHSLLSWRVLLKGSPKRPTKEKGPTGILKTALIFLDGQWTSDDEAKLHAFQAKFEK
jgi:hypothetical protein